VDFNNFVLDIFVTIFRNRISGIMEVKRRKSLLVFLVLYGCICCFNTCVDAQTPSSSKYGRYNN